MKKQFLILKSTALLAISIGFYACDPTKVETKQVSGSVYVVCEGNFNAANGAISVYNEGSKLAQVDIYKDKNGVPLGDLVQSLTFDGDKGYIVVNNSNKLEIVDASTFASKGVINGLKLPRYFAKVGNNKAYVTEYVSYLENGRVAVIDLASNTVSKTIQAGYLPENLLVHDSKIFVSNNGGNTISVINPNTDAVENTITVAGAPARMAVDANGKIWVLCRGTKSYKSDFSIDLANSTAGALVRFDPTTLALETTISLANVADSPSNLMINSTGDKLYYLNGAVFEQSINAMAINTTPLINRNFYGLGIQPSTGTIYVGTFGFISNQKLIRYNTNGVALDSAEVGIGPREFVFK